MNMYVRKLAGRQENGEDICNNHEIKKWRALSTREVK
jgi:hypothetical protein